MKGRSKGHHLPPEERDILDQALLGGVPGVQLAEHFGVGSTAVSARRRRLGLPDGRRTGRRLALVQHYLARARRSPETAAAIEFAATILERDRVQRGDERYACACCAYHTEDEAPQHKRCRRDR